MLDDDLLRRLKRRAAEEQRSLKDLVNGLLRLALGRPPRAKYEFRWKTHRGQIQPGVRLDDREALFDLMDGR